MCIGALTDLWLRNERGEPLEQDTRLVPAHLRERTWRFLCTCGYAWKTPAPSDAIQRDGRWRGPESECVGCHAWVEGVAVAPE